MSHDTFILEVAGDVEVELWLTLVLIVSLFTGDCGESPKGKNW